MEKPICAVVGVGPGNGAALARRFAAGGYAVALMARGSTQSGTLAAELDDARAYECDVADATSVKDTFARVRAELGEVDVLVYNAGSGSWGSIEEITPEAFEAAWRVNALGSLLVARQVIPAMKRAGTGSIIFIGATASLRGMPRTAAFAPAKAAQRILAESMARSLWPAGIHVALVVLDGVVDLPKTREMMPDKSEDFFIKPKDVAESAFWLSGQARSAWSFAIEARPFGETW
jgi:NAD(P)-dependent dehydrogenase (short-subunit alcohol dehydrogenase family)